MNVHMDHSQISVFQIHTISKVIHNGNHRVPERGNTKEIVSLSQDF